MEQQSDPYATSRNSTATAFKWRESLTWANISTIQEVCRSASANSKGGLQVSLHHLYTVQEDCRSAYTTYKGGLQVSLYHLYKRSAGQPIPPVQEV